MDKITEKITLVNLECVLMPNGEIICDGQTVGWFSVLGKYLTIKCNEKK